MPSPDKPTRKLAAIMFTDIAGFTEFSARDDEGAFALIEKQREILKPIVSDFGGEWLKEMGDGLLLSFPSSKQAVNCAIKIQHTVKEIDDLNLRIGIHQGDILEKDGDIFGDDVNVASRIEPFSTIGGVAISHKVQSDISSSPEFETKFVSQPSLKGVRQEVKVYCITSHDLPETEITKVTAKLEKKTNWFRYAVSAAAVVALLTYYFIPKEKEVPSIGILMMENLGIEDDNFWSRVITEDLIVKVAGAGLIRVAPMKEILEIDLQKSFEEIAKKLRVKYLLTSSMHKQEDGFDLRCQLIEAESGVSTYAKKWSELLENSPTIVGNLADDILKTLNVTSKQNITKAPTTNTEAYEFYLKGNYKFDNRKNEEDTEVARGLLEKAIALDDSLILAMAHLGWTYRQTDDFEKSIEIFEEVIKKSEELDDKSYIIYSISNIGYMWGYRGEYDKALKSYNRALNISEELGDMKKMGYALRSIGYYNSLKDDYDKFFEYSNRALELAEKLGDKISIAYTFDLFADIYRRKGEYDNALDYYTRSLEIAEDLEDEYAIELLKKIGDLYSQKDDLDTGLDYFKRALKIAEDLEDEYAIELLKKIGDLYYQKQDLDKSMEYYKRALKIAKELGDRDFRIDIFDSVASNYMASGENEKALDYYNRLLELAEELGYKYWIANTYSIIGIIYQRMDDLEKGLDYHNRSLDIFRELDDKMRTRGAHSMIGVMLFGHFADLNKALVHFNEVLKISEELGDGRWMAQSFNSIGNIYMAKGDYDKALGYYDRTKNISEDSRRRIQYSHKAKALKSEASIYSKIGHYDKALENYDLALKIYDEDSSKNNVRNIFRKKAIIYSKIGDHDKALEYITHFFEEMEEIGDNWLVSNSGRRVSETILRKYSGYTKNIHMIGELHYFKGNNSEAIKSFKKAFDLWREMGKVWDWLKSKKEENLSLSWLILTELKSGNRNQQDNLNLISDMMPNDKYYDEEILVFNWNMYQIYTELNNDKKAKKYLKVAYDELTKQADKIQSSEYRESFLTNVRLNREIVKKWEKNN